MSKSRAKGTRGEWLAIRDFLHRWWPKAERRALMGIADKGDVVGTPFTVSIKNCEKWLPHQWLEELSKMEANSGDPGFVMARRNHQKGWVFLVPETTMRTMLDAMYGGAE